MVLTIDVDVGISETVAMFVGDVALYHLSIFCRHVHKRQVVEFTTDTPRVGLHLCSCHCHKDVNGQISRYQEKSNNQAVQFITWLTFNTVLLACWQFCQHAVYLT